MFLKSPLTATLGEFSCSEDPDPLHCHAISHPAGLWMGIHVPGLGHTTARDVNPVTQCHLIAHIDTTLDRWFGVSFDPNGDFLAFEGTATPEAAHSPDDRATRISLCASVRKDDETVDFTAFGSVDDGNIQDTYGKPPTPWRGHRALGTDARFIFYGTFFVLHHHLPGQPTRTEIRSFDRTYPDRVPPRRLQPGHSKTTRRSSWMEAWNRTTTPRPCKAASALPSHQYGHIVRKDREVTPATPPHERGR